MWWTEGRRMRCVWEGEILRGVGAEDGLLIGAFFFWSRVDVSELNAKGVRIRTM
jgi:hypothetical protein